MSPTYDDFWEETYNDIHIAIYFKNGKYNVFLDKTLIEGWQFTELREAKEWLRNKVDGIDHETRREGRWERVPGREK
jgi:hypothetical protein